MDTDGFPSTIDLRVFEAMASEIGHDLVGPLGFFDNCVDLLQLNQLQEFDELAESDRSFLRRRAVKSANHAVDILKFKSLAYGDGNINPMEIRKVVDNFLRHNKSEVDWAAGPAPEDVPVSAAKVFLNLVALADKALPFGGTIRIKIVVRAEAEYVVLMVESIGREAGLWGDLRNCLTSDVSINDLTPRNVISYYTRANIKRMGGTIETQRRATNLVAVLPI